MDPEEITAIVKDAVSEAMSAHPCWMNAEDQAMLRDMLQGGKYVKKSLLMLLAGMIVYAIAKAVMVAKGWK